MKVRLVTVTPDAEHNIVEIARVSSSRADKSTEIDKLIGYLIKNSHWSPFEHAYMTVEIQTSKAIGIQLLRHRSFTFQEFSQRYADVRIQGDPFEPVSIRKQSTNNRQSSTEEFDPIVMDPVSGRDVNASEGIQDCLDYIEDLYGALLDAGMARECARMILPMTSRTTIHMTGCIRSWIHFLKLRDDEHAQLEAQLIAREIKAIFKEQFPVVSAALNY
jgi:thymidylate synthase (FAD)